MMRGRRVAGVATVVMAAAVFGAAPASAQALVGFTGAPSTGGEGMAIGCSGCAVGNRTDSFGGVTFTSSIPGGIMMAALDSGASIGQVTTNATAMSIASVDGGGAQAVTPVPEPTTWAMLLAGFGALGFVLRRSPAGARRRFA